ncbi:MAG: hypothetical protein M3137_20000 [Actinomycetota bacterium]|nr:hypothetical protein [Actinomycetota bacterium]
MGSNDLIPTGHCWCGCGATTGLAAFFVEDHETLATMAVIDIEYGGTPSFLLEHGFGPEGRNPIEELKG